MAAVAPSRLAALTRLRCEIFQTSFNPTSVRTGAKYLRARLRGPAMTRYYPHELTIAKFNRMPGDFKIQDWDEYQRLADVEEKKRRGKGVPKKAKSAGQSCMFFDQGLVLKSHALRQRRVAGCPGNGSGNRALSPSYCLHVQPFNDHPPSLHETLDWTIDTAILLYKIGRAHV